MESLKVFAFLFFLGCCSAGARAQITVSLALDGRSAQVVFSQTAEPAVTYSVTVVPPHTVSALAIYSLPTRINLGPAERCANIGMQETAFTLPSISAGTVSGASNLTDLLHRTLLVTFADGSAVCATISRFTLDISLARVDFVRGVVGTLYLLEEAGTVYIRGQLLSADGDTSIVPLDLFLHSATIPAYANSPASCTTSNSDREIASNTGFMVSQNSQFNLMSYVYKGVSLRSQAGVVLACARLERVNPVTASYVSGITFTEILQFAPALVNGGNMAALAYPILNEIGTSDGTCIDENSIFNPWNGTVPCSNLTTPDQCPLGDLRGHALEVMGLTVLQVPLSGRASIIGHAINVSDCTNWVRPVAGATNSHIAMATVTFNGPVVFGAIVFRQVVYQTNNELGPAFIAVDLRQNRSQTSTHAWHVHQRRIGPNGECGSVFAGGHYNPFAVSLTTESGYPTDCNDLNQHRCEMGDLSGKHGRLTLEPSTAEPRRTVSYFDETLDLWGPYTVMGRSIVVHDVDGSRLGCANIEPAVLANEEVIFYFPQNGTMPNDVDRIELNSEIANEAAVPLGTVLVYDVTNTTVNGNGCLRATIRVTGSDATTAESNRMAVVGVNRNNLNQFSAGLCGAGTGLASFSISLISLLVIGVASLYLME